MTAAARCVLKTASLLSVVACLSVHAAATVRQGKRSNAATGSAVDKGGKLTLNQQDALILLQRLAAELKGEADKSAAAILQAQVADTLWEFDEQAARSIFRSAFDAARQPPPDAPSGGGPKAVASSAVRRQATAVREVLRRLGAHDRASADSWLREIEEDEKKTTTEDAAPGSISPERAELLAQIALELAPSDPQKALSLGLLALSGEQIPEAFGRLLFALNTQDRKLSDSLFSGALAAVQRNGFRYSPAIIPLTNYVFDAQGKRYLVATAPEAQLLIDFFVAAANAQTSLWRETRLSGGQSLSESGAGFLSFFVSRAMPIIKSNSPEKLPVMETLVSEMSAGLSQQQQRQVDALTSTQQQQQAVVSAGGGSDLDSQIDRAERETDPQMRNLLLRAIALNLMRGDTERAVSVADKIDDPEMRAQTVDDVNFVSLLIKLRSQSYDEARRIALNLNDTSLRARVLAELADYALSTSKDYGRAIELLSEASSTALKGEDTPDKLAALLFIAGRFSSLDSARGFETLAAATKTMNHLAKDVRTPSAPALNPPPVRIKTYTVINGKEMTTGEHSTVESIDFDQIGAFAKLDYVQTRALGESVQDKLLRARFLVAVAKGVLRQPPK